jgi:hypothetical protein
MLRQRSQAAYPGSAIACAAFFLLAFTRSAGAAEQNAPIEATTVGGEKVLLHPNGRWEYVNPQKAAAAREVAREYPENQGCPAGWQGGLLGFGRCIPPGDKDFNRGSLNPNRR